MSNTYNFSNRKLTDAEANEMRKQYAADPKASYSIMAKRFNLSFATAQRILNGKFYRHPNPLERVQ